jgi:Fic family protein
MVRFYPSRITIDSEIARLMEAVSRKQGELDGLKRDIRDDARIESIAAVDAVHFSTKIEGNTLSRDQVTEVLQASRTKKKLKAPARELNEVLNYSRARRMMRERSLKAKPLNDDWVLEHHAELLKGILKGRLRGHYREAQCVVQDSRTRSIVYMAPEWKDVPPLMKGLLSWLRKQRQEGMSPLLLAAQFHFEFVTIHPFMDGNGRLGRLLTNGILLAGGYDVERYAALEKQHELDRARYYRALRSMQAGNFYDIPEGQNIQPWVEYWLRCLLSTYEEALSRVAGTATGTSLPVYDNDRLSKAEAIFRRHQRLKASQYADLMGLGRTQAVADLNALVDAGLLERVGGGRSTIYRWKEKVIPKSVRPIP